MHPVYFRFGVKLNHLLLGAVLTVLLRKSQLTKLKHTSAVGKHRNNQKKEIISSATNVHHSANAEYWVFHEIPQSLELLWIFPGFKATKITERNYSSD